MFPTQRSVCQCAHCVLGLSAEHEKKLFVYSSDINTLVKMVPNMWGGAVNGSRQEIEKKNKKKIPVVQNVVSFFGFSFLCAKL